MGLTGVGTFARRIFWLCWAPCCMSELSSVKSSQGACAENFQSLRLLLHNYGPQWPDSSLSCGLKKTHCPCPRVVHTSAASQLAVNVVLRCRDNNSRTKIVENFSQYLSSKSWGDWKKIIWKNIIRNTLFTSKTWCTADTHWTDCPARSTTCMHQVHIKNKQNNNKVWQYRHQVMNYLVC